jgi:predicted nucleic acid-binding protein
MKFVLDASIALLWLVPQTNPSGIDYADAILTAMKESQAVVPTLFALEVANVVAKLESKGLVTEAARRYKFSAYDAAYLAQALRSGLSLSTLDADLAKAQHHVDYYTDPDAPPYPTRSHTKQPYRVFLAWRDTSESVCK